jgi:hypothetical protein
MIQVNSFLLERSPTNRCTRQSAVTVCAERKQRQPPAGERHSRWADQMKIAFLFGAILASILTVLNLEVFGFAETGLLALFEIILLPMLGSVLFIAGRKGSRKGLKLAGAAVFLSNFSGCAISIPVAHYKERGSMKVGDEICIALEQYKDDSGFFPLELSALVPQYLSMLPSSQMGAFSSIPFFYNVDETGNYYFGFKRGSFIICERQKDGVWRCDD